MKCLFASRVLFLSCITACLSGVAQEPIAKPEIHGVVLEPGTKQPVVDAEVSLYFLGEERPMVRFGIGSLTPTSKTPTDATGAFVFHPDKLGYYTVAVKKEGHSAPGSGEGKNILDVTLTAAEPTGEARLTLSRPGQITGTVVDETTGKPIPKLSVIPGKLTRLDGRLMVGGTPVITGADGRFVAPNLPSGDYVVIVPAQRSGKERIISKFSESDLKTVDEDYPLTYWPGGQGLETATPLMVNSGASVDFGKVQTRKVPYYRAARAYSGGSMRGGR